LKNPLWKRYKRELKSDFGKYIAIALFMIMLIGVVSGYLVAADSIEKTFYEGWEKYNIEDGHITFSKTPTDEVLSQIEQKANLKFYNLEYADEDIDNRGTTLRIFKIRADVDGGCLLTGQMPQSDNEIAVDRIFAQNNNIQVGDFITINGKSIKVTGYIALVDYNCLFEKNTDMMMNAQIFGVGEMTEGGYEAINSTHVFANYAWKYTAPTVDEKDENNRSEELLDVLEEVIKDYDETLIQAEVDDLYEKANGLGKDLEDEFENASEEITDKTTKASENVAKKLIESLSDDEKMMLYLSGATQEEYLGFALKKQNADIEELVAEELGTTIELLEAFEESAKDLENNLDDMGTSSEAPKISLDEDNEYDSEMDFSFDEIREVSAKLDATGLYDVSKINGILDELEDLSNYEFDENKLLTVENYVPKYQNKAITFCMDDMKSDKPSFIIFAYIVIVIIAFVFTVNISASIQKEAGVIGTLRASGYSRAELVRHYLFMPTVVTIVAAVIGNILGYTVFVEYMKDVFYTSFSLATYESIFNIEAFVLTTVIPILIMIAINLYMLNSKLKLSPIRFLRRDLAKKKKRRAVLLNKKISFLSRFRLRILFQNISAYITLTVGIIFGGIIAIFGFMFGPLLLDYADLIVSEQICNYQYILMDQVETDTEGAEKYCIGSLELSLEGYLKDEISIYGISENSAYITKDIPDGEVLVSEGILAKYGLKNGDTLTLQDPYSDKKYDFVIADSYPYSAALSVFMDRSDYIQMFDEKEDYFTGYLSDVEITDIGSEDIASVITESDLTKVSDQMMQSIGSFMDLFKYFGAIMLALLMYLMTKQVIEKNAQSIAMTKILGFTNKEIAGLYLIMTGFVALVAIVITIPITDIVLRLIFEKILYTEMSGYLPYIVSNSCYVYTAIICILCFVIVSSFMFVKIGKIEKSEALKNVE